MSAVTTKFREMNGYDAYTHIVARIADLIVVIISAYLAYFMRFGTFDMIERYKWAMLLGIIIATVVFPYSKVYQSWRGKLRVLLVYRISIAYLMIGALLLVFAFFSARGDSFSRIWVLTWIFSGTCVSCLLRIVAYPVINHLRAQGKNRRRVLLIGDAHSCATAHEHIVRTPSTGFDISRVLLINKDIDNELSDSNYEFYQPGVCIEHSEAEVWICLPVEEGRTVRKIQDDLSLSTSNVRYMPNMADFRLINHNISTVAGLYMLDMSCSPMTGWNRFIKASEDRVISALFLLLILPVFMVIALAVKMTSHGPIFYRQERMSWNGTSFKMLKFRSMPMDVESNGVSWGGARQKKTTKLGAFLRKTSLDELPQFINVLKGDMSIVGPRPERTIFVDEFKNEIPGYMQKHMVKAGITGWAQINGWRGDTDLAKRIECDLWYIENWSIGLDIRIIFLTIFKGLVNKNAC